MNHHKFYRVEKFSDNAEIQSAIQDKKIRVIAAQDGEYISGLEVFEVLGIDLRETA